MPPISDSHCCKSVSIYTVSLIIKIEPCAKPRMTRRDRIPRLQSKTVRKYFDWKASMQLKLKECRAKAIDKKGLLICQFTIAMPKSWSKKKKQEMEGQHHRQRPDIDNLVKALMDAAYIEDCTIHTINASKVWGSTGHIYILTANAKS